MIVQLYRDSLWFQGSCLVMSLELSSHTSFLCSWVHLAALQCLVIVSKWNSYDEEN